MTRPTPYREFETRATITPTTFGHYFQISHGGLDRGTGWVWGSRDRVEARVRREFAKIRREEELHAASWEMSPDA